MLLLITSINTARATSLQHMLTALRHCLSPLLLLALYSSTVAVDSVALLWQLSARTIQLLLQTDAISCTNSVYYHISTEAKQHVHRLSYLNSTHSCLHAMLAADADSHSTTTHTIHHEHFA
jgi:sensor domain CHASE-containing protein